MCTASHLDSRLRTLLSAWSYIAEARQRKLFADLRNIMSGGELSSEYRFTADFIARDSMRRLHAKECNTSLLATAGLCFLSGLNILIRNDCKLEVFQESTRILVGRQEMLRLSCLRIILKHKLALRSLLVVLSPAIVFMQFWSSVGENM